MNKTLLSSYKSIAILQTAFIGDVVLTLPLAAKIKQINPDCRLTFITTHAASEIPSLLNDIDKVIIYDKRGKYNGLKGLFRFKNEIQNNNFDCIITPHRSLRSALLTKLLNPEISISFNTSTFSMLYSKKVKYRIDFHEKKRNLSLLSVFSDFDNDYNLNPDLELRFGLDDTDFINQLISDYDLKNKKLILIAPGSVWETKKWKEYHFSELIKKIESININCILIGSKVDYAICEKIAKDTKSINLAGITSIPQTILLMQRAKLLITNDSGPIHFAGVAKCPTIAVFGPTTPKFGFAPTGKNDIIIENNILKCRPCAIHGSNTCPLGTHECMTSITPENVFNEIRI